MPWDVKKSDECPASRPWAVIAQDGEIMGCHPSRERALRQQAALYANEPDAGKSGRTGMTETKTLSGFEIKDAEQGMVQAVFSTFNVKDHDGDVTLPGAFTEGAPVRISAWGHSSWGPSRGSSSVPMLPVGKGVIRTTDTEAILEGQFFMGTQHGRDTFTTVKELGDLQEWSYGYEPVDTEPGEFEGQKVRFLKKLDVPEVSPVLQGAGIGTRTVAVKDKHHPFSEQADQVLGDLVGLIDRAKAFGSQSSDAERKEGRALSAANRERLANLLTALGESAGALQELLEATDPEKHRNALIREYARFERLRAGF